MNPGTPHASLHVTHLGLGADDCARVSGLSAVFPAGLSLIVDEEGEAKTPLLRLLAGEMSPDAGTVRWRGAAVAGLPEAEQSVLEAYRTRAQVLQAKLRDVPNVLAAERQALSAR